MNEFTRRQAIYWQRIARECYATAFYWREHDMRRVAYFMRQGEHASYNSRAYLFGEM